MCFVEQTFFNDEEHQVDCQVGRWMVTPYFIAIEGKTMRQLLEILSCSQNQELIVINKDHHVLGLITYNRVSSLLLQGVTLEHKLERTWIEKTPVLHENQLILQVTFEDHKTFPVINEGGKLLGAITLKEKIHACEHFIKSVKRSEEALNIILETAYEGVVFVDETGIIRKMNKAYRNFLGIPSEEDVIDKPVEDVIENTQLHATVKAGIPERGKVQTIQGQKMIVHRIPIWQNNKIVGAIGMLIFEGVSELYRILEHATNIQLKKKSDEQRSIEQKKNTNNLHTFEKMIGNSNAMNASKSMARKAARTNATVLITGESGTGKELFAQSIHRLSARSEGPFISINCAAIPEHLLEAELFGYEGGAFTGAKKGGKSGKFELANTGTIFLDEIGDMPLQMQTKILRVLQEKEIVRVGGDESMNLDVRIIAATNQELLERVNSGDFREDLYYRLNVIHIEVPPLRKRKEDIPVLMSHYLHQLSKEYDFKPKTVDEKAMKAFMSYEWPGNIRELVNTAEQLITLVDGEVIKYDHLPNIIKEQQNVLTLNHEQPLKEESINKEKSIIERILEEMNGNKTKTAEKLGIHRTTLYNKIKRYGIVTSK